MIEYKGLMHTMLLEAETFPITHVTVLLIIVLILLLLSAITSGAETAFFSLNAKDINYIKTKDDPNTRLTAKLLEQPKILMATIMVAGSFINIAIVISSNLLIRELLPKDMGWMAVLLIQIVAITLLLIFFGNILPKVYASQNNMRMALFAAPLLRVFNEIFQPISKTLISSSGYIEGRINARQSGNINTEDFEEAIELSLGHTATRDEVNIFKGILNFSNITVKQVMRTRMDVSGIPFDASFAQVRAFSLKTGFSRIPVYKENLDKITGMVYTKDFLPHFDEPDFDWHTLLRPAYFVHEGKLIEDLLKEFQQKRIHFAIVVDEFGGTSGIVSMEDIMEEIIGEIRDEFDEEELQFKRLDDRNFIFEGKTNINDVCRIMSIPADDFNEIRGESDSLAGLVLEISGRFPTINEVFTYKNYEFTVLELDGRRIQRVKISVGEREKQR